MKDRVILRASLNLEDEHEKRLHDHATKNKNVSAYLKRLMTADMEGKSETVSSVHIEEVEDKEDDDLSSFV